MGQSQFGAPLGTFAVQVQPQVSNWERTHCAAHRIHGALNAPASLYAAGNRVGLCRYFENYKPVFCKDI
jgi:hypothetical protein